MHALHVLNLTTFESEIQSRHYELNEAIDIDSKSLHILRANAQVSFHVFLRCTVPLTVLDLADHVDDYPLFFVFLEATPSITHLTLPGFFSPTRFPIPHKLLHLAPSSLPHLHHLLCPSPVASSFFNRPTLRSLGLKGRVYYENPEDYDAPIVEVLPFPSAILQHLSIPAHVFFSTSLVEYYPDLKVLHMRELFSDFPQVSTYPRFNNLVVPSRNFKKVCSLDRSDIQVLRLTASFT